MEDFNPPIKLYIIFSTVPLYLTIPSTPSGTYFETFLDNYPNHANRKRAEKFLVESRKKIPTQLYKEGIQYEHNPGDHDKMHFRVFDSTKMTIRAESWVGIGTTNPSTRLDVIGSAKANDLILGSAVVGNYDYVD